MYTNIFFRKDEGGAIVYRTADGGRTYNKAEAMTATDVQFVIVMANQGWDHLVIKEEVVVPEYYRYNTTPRSIPCSVRGCTFSMYEGDEHCGDAHESD